MGRNKVSFKVSEKKSRVKGILDYIHSNVGRQVPIKSHGGARYYVTFTDDYSWKTWV